MRLLYILILFFSGFLSNALAENRYAVQAQIQYAPPSGSVAGALIEAKLDGLPEGMTLQGRYGYLEYYYEEEDYWEEGWGPLYGVGAKYYTSGTPMQGWYVSGELLYFDVTVYWDGYAASGWMWIEGFVPALSAGYHKRFENFFIEPQAMMAISAVAANDSDAPPVILTIGLGAGIEF